MRNLTRLAVATAFVPYAAFGLAHALPITVSITNESATDGLGLTPLFVAFHDGSYDAFDVGGFASMGTARVAELGNPDIAMSEALAADADAVTGSAGAPGGFAGAPIIEPGETATVTLEIDPFDQRFFTYLSMVLPSNDTFIGNDNPIEIFDMSGNYLGDRTLNLTGFNIWDAGTEANDLTDGPAFVVGQTGTEGTVTNDPVALSDGIAAIAAMLPPGNVLNPILADFASDRENFQLATITIEAAPVPLPAALPMFGAALAGFGAMRWRRAKTKSA